jgi:hypothetical protein
MWTCNQSPAVAVIFVASFFLAAQLAAAAADDQNPEAARIAQEFAEKVESYNKLLKQERFDEAIVLAKEARLLQPENPMGELMVLKGMFAKQDAINRLTIKFEATLAADLPEGPESSLATTLASPTDRTVRRLISGKDPDDMRRLLNAALRRRIEAVDADYRLTGAQRRALQLAGRGDIERFLDRVKVVRPKVLRPDDLEHRLLCSMAGHLDDDESPPARGLGLFEHGSLFSKTLRVSLTRIQPAAFESSTSQ